MSKSYIESSVYSPPRPLPPRNYVAVSDDKTISSCTPSDDTISTCDLSISSSDVTPPKPPPPLSYTSTLPPPCPSPSPRSKRSKTLPHKKNRMTHSKDIEVTRYWNELYEVSENNFKFFLQARNIFDASEDEFARENILSFLGTFSGELLSWERCRFPTVFSKTFC